MFHGNFYFYGLGLLGVEFRLRLRCRTHHGK